MVYEYKYGFKNNHKSFIKHYMCLTMFKPIPINYIISKFYVNLSSAFDTTNLSGHSDRLFGI
jgi:hypothetical protein